jgi:GxxExxY protein
LAHELREIGLRVGRQVTLPLGYSGTTIEAGYRLDILVEGRVVVEVKAVEKITPLHEAQTRGLPAWLPA